MVKGRSRWTKEKELGEEGLGEDPLHLLTPPMTPWIRLRKGLLPYQAVTARLPHVWNLTAMFSQGDFVVLRLHGKIPIERSSTKIGDFTTLKHKQFRENDLGGRSWTTVRDETIRMKAHPASHRQYILLRLRQGQRERKLQQHYILRGPSHACR